MVSLDIWFGPGLSIPARPAASPRVAATLPSPKVTFDANTDWLCGHGPHRDALACCGRAGRSATEKRMEADAASRGHHAVRQLDNATVFECLGGSGLIGERRMQYRQLYCFVKIIEADALSQAALSIPVALQPAVSRKISKLKASFALELLQGSAREDGGRRLRREILR